ncbi:MAG: hypothetical protein FJ102_00785 [Deltaproteobacteria bacterium]|nr:hypothetical protein [Deltaproteobacteria bacterium]
MLLALLADLAHADGILDAGGIGAAGATNQDGALAGGLALSHLAGDFDAWVLFGSPDASENVVRAWNFSVGGWTPTFITERKPVSKGDQNQQSELGVATDPGAKKRKLLLGTPLLRVAGSTWTGERFRADMGGEGMINLLDLAGVAPASAYAGLTFGGRTEVVYSSVNRDTAATGALVLDAGVALGGTVANAAVGRLKGRVEVDPFLGEVVLNSGVLLAGSLARTDVPLALRVDLEAWTHPARDMATDWRAMLYALVSSD